MTCGAVSPGAGLTGGESWTNNTDGTNPGSASVDFSSSAGGGMITDQTLNNGQKSNLLFTVPKGGTALAITGQTLTITGFSGTYTVTADTFGATPATRYPETLSLTPALNGAVGAVKAKAVVSVNPTTTTPYRVANVTFSGGNTITSSVAFAAGDDGQPVTGETGAVLGAGGHAITDGSGNTLTVVSHSGTTATLSGTPSTGPSGGPWTAVPSAATGTVTIGLTLQAPANITSVLNLVASNCGVSKPSPGDFAPLTANLNGVAQAQTPNSALALEAAPPATNIAITYPTIGAGWADNGGFPNVASQPSTQLNFPGGKDNVFYLQNGAGACPGQVNCDSMIKGVATGDWPTTKGQLGLAATGLIFCTVAEAEAIAGTPNSGGPDNTANGGWIHTGDNASSVCEGGSSNPNDNSESTALGVIITLELNPSANAYGTDNTPPTSIWNIAAQQGGNTIF
jgi:hypothetical protein